MLSVPAARGDEGVDSSMALERGVVAWGIGRWVRVGKEGARWWNAGARAGEGDGEDLMRVSTWSSQ